MSEITNTLLKGHFNLAKVAGMKKEWLPVMTEKLLELNKSNQTTQ